ncbi:ATP-binding protein [Marinicrinis lubricantis]|uniref:histidine kinase n=1 Tax=Marinicrinis lubricantis TaxID=2086470 RepID=A0ABW1IW30_9BACL
MSFPLLMQIPSSMEDLYNYLNQCCFQSVVVLDQDEEVLFCNTAFTVKLGYSLEEIKGTGFRDLSPETESAQSLLVKGFTQTNTLPKIQIADKSGVMYSSSAATYRIEFREGMFCYMVVLYDLMHSSKDKLIRKFSANFLKDINLGVLLIDHEFRLVDISDTACKVLGVEREQILQHPLDEIFAPIPKEYQFVQRSILEGAVIKNHAFSWTNQNQRYELLLDSSAIKDDWGKVVGAYILFKDVSNLRSLEEQVQRSDRLAMIGQIAAGTAHEIRNPLTSIKGFLQVLKKTMREHGLLREHEYTELMLTEINRINELVSEFLMLSKPKELNVKRVDVSMVIREILPIINNEAILHNIDVHYEAELQLPYVVADKELLKQVCINICKNGIEAMSKDGTLTIRERIDQEQAMILLEIHDTGPGIPSFLVDKIFDPFFTTKENGTGLGLSVCQRIIHDLGGAIRVSSKGYGTTFTISLPY